MTQTPKCFGLSWARRRNLNFCPAQRPSPTSRSFTRLTRRSCRKNWRAWHGRQEAETSESLSDCVLVDQRLEAGIFTQWIPNRMELKDRDAEPVWNFEQMIDQAQRLVMVSSTRTNLRKRAGDRRSAIGVFRFGQQFHSTFALGDGSVFLTKGG